jgi:hypothetical protein
MYEFLYIKAQPGEACEFNPCAARKGAGMKCQWCGRDIFYGDNYWHIDGKGVFCSQKCLDEWKWEKGGGKADAEWRRQVQEESDKYQRSKEQYWEQRRAEQAEKKRSLEAEAEHFRPFIEKRVGHPLSLEDVWWNQRTQTWGAKEEIMEEASGALKALEAESGVKISAIPGFMGLLQQGYFTWFAASSRWGFMIPHVRNFVMKDAMGRSGDSGSRYASHSGIQGTPDWECFPEAYMHWVVANDLAPLIAVAGYEKRSVQDLDLSQGGQGYWFIPDISCVVSYTEVHTTLIQRFAKKELHNSVFPQFSPSENKFYADVPETKKNLFGKWVTHTYHLEVSLYDLQIRIPVKEIQVKPAPPPEDEFEDGGEWDEDDVEFEEDEDEDFDEDEEPVKETAAAAPKFCTRCGAKLDAGVKFCTGCGTKIGG